MMNVMKLRKEQIDILSNYFADISKVVVASSAIGFFIPTNSGPVSVKVAIFGLVAGIAFILLAVALKPQQQ